jgi:CrcB protein
MLVAVAAGLGAVLRYLVDSAVPRRHFPRGTILVNTSGSFVLGLLTGGSTVVTVGLLGGYTTLSTFAVESVALAERGRRAAAVANVVVSAVLGLGAAALGLWIG